MKSLILKRSVVIAGHKTSISLEDPFWKALKEIAALRNMPLSNLVASIDGEREHANLSSATRLFVLENWRPQLREQIASRGALRAEAARCPASPAEKIQADLVGGTIAA
jgi:predicted DNA-binding ribbon-helix-helix protein